MDLDEEHAIFAADGTSGNGADLRSFIRVACLPGSIAARPAMAGSCGDGMDSDRTRVAVSVGWLVCRERQFRGPAGVPLPVPRFDGSSSLDGELLQPPLRLARQPLRIHGARRNTAGRGQLAAVWYELIVVSA